MATNYRKGFFRFYAFVSACWVAFWLYLAFSQLMLQRRTAVPTQLSTQIDEARKNRYSDDEILGYLEEKRPDLAKEIQQGKQEAHSSTDIIASLKLATVADVLKDPRFHALTQETRRSVLARLDPQFANLPQGAQDEVIEFKPSQAETVEADPSSIQRDAATGKWFVKQRDYGEAALSLEMALIPPAAGYVLLFIIVPWIGRGFRASK